MYTKRKLFIFHNKKVVTHIEQQPNQSKYIESLVINDLKPKQEVDIVNILQEYLHSIQVSTQIHSKNKPDGNISNSISNILNLV